MTTLNLSGKIAVVTGASAGIGEATAVALAGAGMTVVATARRTDRLEALAQRSDGIVAYTADVTVAEDVRSLATEVAEKYGACHVLVNNAGASFGDKVRGPDDLADVGRTMDLNLLGSVRCMTELSDLLFRSAPARVINVASVAGKLGVGPPAYVASKFALVGFTEAIGPDWARKGVTVSQVNPGFIQTEQFPQDELRANPLTRRIVGTPEDVAAAIVEVAHKGTRERTVPRWYRAGTVARHIVPPAYRAAAKRISF